MKKLFLAVCLVLAFALPVLAASTVTVTDNTKLQTHTYRIDWTTNTGAVAVADSTIYNVWGEIVDFEVDPGSPAPTANYDVVITDARGYDVFRGLLANLPSTRTWRDSVTSGPKWLNQETLTFSLSGNSVTNAVGTVQFTTRTK